ncbi:AAA domain-containing protein [Pseudomonas sp. AAC]|uniref:AAA domain-containing protein n=1 Tax=Pseudomonas sp. AAC TaxID=1502784 RepID=UPI0004D89F70|nr:AAA domain-containing protein [Pseudomonas sp. AAC]KES23064.1 nuclease [Pseudomonas sp. AAC]
MEVRYWEGGLHSFEVEAIERMAKAFAPNEEVAQSGTPTARGNSFAVLKQLKKPDGMWPWKGYAGFRFANSRGSDGEFDLVIITHSMVLVVELKHWNGKITSNGNKWYQDGKERDASPVERTRRKMYELKKRMQSIKASLPKGREPWFEFCVVLSGKCTLDLPDAEMPYVMQLEEFLGLADEKQFRQRYPKAFNVHLNDHFGDFDKLLNEGFVKPKELVVDDYRAIAPAVFIHPTKVYSEFDSVNIHNKDDHAMLRLWDFSKLDSASARTKEGRFKILSREREILVYLKRLDQDLVNRCARFKGNVSPDSITEQYSELFEMPDGHFRLNEFINRFVVRMSDGERLQLLKILLAQFASLHGHSVAHRDVGDHSVWFSPASGIALSNFISAYHQPIGTVGDLRSLLSIGAISLPEDQGNADLDTTPFKRDVFALGILCCHLIQAKPLPLKLDETYIQGVLRETEGATEWFSEVIRKAIQRNPADRFENAVAFLQALSEATPDNSPSFKFDKRQLDRFATDVRLASAYREDEEPLVDSAEKLLYRSGPWMVKSWPSINAREPQDGQGPMLMSFFETLERLRASSFHFLPKLEHFGYDRSGNPFLAQEHVEGVHWNDLQDLPVPKALIVSRRLIEAVEGLHEQQLSHGDLHPENIMVTLGSDYESTHLHLLDYPDFSPTGERPYNNRYSPLVEDSTPAEKDNFAVMRMVLELLGMDWDTSREGDNQALRDAIDLEKRSDSGYLSLERFNDALEVAFQSKPTIETIDVPIRGSATFDILPDNGKIYVVVRPDPNTPTKALEVLFAGIGGQFLACFDPETKVFTRAFRPHQEQRASLFFVRNANHHLNVRLTVSSGGASNLASLGSSGNLASLSRYLGQDEGFIALAAKILEAEVRKQAALAESDAAEESITGEDAENGLAVDDPKLEGVPVQSFPVGQIWKTITSTELEAQPSFRVAAEPRLHRDNLGLLIPYMMESKALEGFEADDSIRLILRDGEKDIDVGEIDLAKSLRDAVYIPASSKSRRVKADSVLYLQSQQNKTSMARRKSAMDRIINRQSVQPDLLDYFDEKCELVPKQYSDAPTEEDFAVYERIKSDGTVIGLNGAQKEAFTNLVSTGPVGLLQGPPGTGKTEFIAAFAHYLIDKVGVRNILLVSQSHEAVNTAAERIRAHCRRLGTALDVVRFSNRGQVVSEELLDAYSRNIVDRQRNSFSAELKERVGALASSLGLSTEFAQTMVDVNQRITRQTKSLESLEKNIMRATDDEDRAALEALRKAVQNDVSLSAKAYLGDSDLSEVPPQTILERVYARIQSDHGVRPPEFKHCQDLIQLSQDFSERLSSNRANYDEFLMRSRSLVCGTCVGIGLQHLNLAATHFDWVIIDEGARSSPSELAIAMQVGSRILLVGDHSQLRPTYEDEHKKAIAQSLGIPANSAEFQRVMRSDFERVFDSPYGRAARATLKTQYRMLPPIGDLVSEIFYENELKNGERPSPEYFAKKTPGCLSHIVTWLDTGTLGNKAFDSGGQSISNGAEADAIIQLLQEIEADEDFCAGMVREMAESQEPPIGVICMYREQRKLIRKRFAEKSWSEDFRRLVKIETVDSYQGKENHIIIVSLTRAKSDQHPGFLSIPNRINVAISRAMERLIIVGSMKMWSGRNAKLPLGKVLGYIGARQDDRNYKIVPAAPSKRIV